MLLPGTVAQEAMGLAERIRAAVQAAAHIIDEHTIRITVSAGVASSNEGISLEAFLIAADNALYRAKAAGRNRVEMMISSEIICTPRRLSDEASLEKQSAA